MVGAQVAEPTEKTLSSLPFPRESSARALVRKTGSGSTEAGEEEAAPELDVDMAECAAEAGGAAAAGGPTKKRPRQRVVEEEPVQNGPSKKRSGPKKTTPF